MSRRSDIPQIDLQDVGEWPSARIQKTKRLVQWLGVCAVLLFWGYVSYQVERADALAECRAQRATPEGREACMTNWRDEA